MTILEATQSTSNAIAAPHKASVVQGPGTQQTRSDNHADDTDVVPSLHGSEPQRQSRQWPGEVISSS